MALREGLHPRGLGYSAPDASEAGSRNRQIEDKNVGQSQAVYVPKRPYKTDRPLSRPVAFVRGNAQPLMQIDTNVESKDQEPVPEIKPASQVTFNTKQQRTGLEPVESSNDTQKPREDVKRENVGQFLPVSTPTDEAPCLPSADRQKVKPERVHFLSDNEDEDNVVYIPPVRKMFTIPSLPNRESEAVIVQEVPSPAITIKSPAPVIETSAPVPKSRRAKANEKRNQKREARRARKQSSSSAGYHRAPKADLDDHPTFRRDGSDIEWGSEDEVPARSGPAFIGQSAATARFSDRSEGERRLRPSRDRAPSYSNAYEASMKNLVAYRASPAQDESALIGTTEEELASMAAFVNGAAALSIGANQITIDELDDEARLRQESEDEDWQTADSDSEDGASIGIEIEERLILGEDDSGSVETLDSDSDVVDCAQNVRSKGKGKQIFSQSDDSEEVDDSEDGDELFEGKNNWRNADKQLSAEIENFIDRSSQGLNSSRKRKKLFQAIEQGDFTLFDDDDELFSLSSKPKGKGKNRHKPKFSEDDAFMAELQEQWEKDKERKSQKKRERLLARLERQPTKKELKKAKKMGLEPKPKNGIDLHEIHASIQSFLMSPNQDHLSLPPMGKKDRVAVHLLAECYYLKSQSKGSGVRRFPLLYRTAHSTLYGVDDGRVQSILRAAHGDFAMPMERGPKRKGRMNALFRELQEPGSSSRRSLQSMPRNRDGDVVGQHAAQLQDDNVGFRLLAKMGWQEGGQIGKSGGISAPIAAVIKTTRSGLGS